MNGLLKSGVARYKSKGLLLENLHNEQQVVIKKFALAAQALNLCRSFHRNWHRHYDMAKRAENTLTQ